MNLHKFDYMIQHTSDRSAAFAAVVDGGAGVLADHGAAVWAPAEPRLGAPGLHRRRRAGEGF
jgi:hypothetical protein